MGDIYVVPKEKLSAIANAIREKSGKTELMTVAEMPDEIEGISGGDNNETLDRLIDRNLTKIESNVASIGACAFAECSNLKNVYLSEATTIDYKAFQNCRSLELLDLPKATSIGSVALLACHSLTQLVLRSNTMCTYLSTGSAYDPQHKDLKIYVPRALLEQYKTATNWKRMADKFVALEDYTVDGTTTGELIE